MPEIYFVFFCFLGGSVAVAGFGWLGVFEGDVKCYCLNFVFLVCLRELHTV